MPVFKLEPWEGDIELELCGGQFCFELRDRGHRVYVFYHEYGDRGSVTLDADLQKADGYKEYVRRIVELDLPPEPLDKSPQFHSIYTSALSLFNSGMDVDVHVRWEDDGIVAIASARLKKKTVATHLRAVYGPYKLYYSFDLDTKEHADDLKQLVKYAAGLYALFREYVRGGKPDQGVKEKA